MSQVKIWVHPKFRKKLKVVAADEEISVLELTKKLGAEDEPQNIEKIRPKRVNDKFNFKI